MSENMNKNENASREPRAQETVVDIETMTHVRICPRKVLRSLSHLRIDKTRIKPIEGQAPKEGGKADVEAAILAPTQAPSSAESNKPPSSLEPDITEYIAVKKLRFDMETGDGQALAPFAHEVGLLNDLSHQNVVKIIGFVEDVDNGVAWMVFCWEKNGNLREFVRSEDWELPERVCLINDVASGIRYLHERNPPICHGDLKSLNILINYKNRAVITDFGSAHAINSAKEAALSGVNATNATKIKSRTSTGVRNTEPLKADIAESGEFITMTGPAWTVRWAAPELLDGDLPGLGSDVWAFGWICWEAVTGNFPFDGENDINATLRIMARDLPTLHDNSQLKQMKMLCSLVEECWMLDANERPSATRCKQMVSWMNQTIPVRRSGDDLSITRSGGLLHALGQIELFNGAMAKAHQYFRQSLEVSEAVDDENGKASALRAIGDAYRMQAKYLKAEESFIRSRDLFSKTGNRIGFADTVKSLGDVYRLRNEYPKARESYIQSRDLFSTMGNQVGFAHSVQGLGDVYLMKNEYSKAEEAYIQSRDLFSKLGNQLSFAHSVRALGEVHQRRKEYSKAEESYIQSRDIYSKIGDQLGFAYSVRALGDVHQTRNEYSKAEESYIQSCDVYSRIGYQPGLALSFEVLGGLYRVRNDYHNAEEAYIQSRNLYSKVGNQFALARSLRGLGDVYRVRKEYSKAEESYIQSRDLYAEIRDQGGYAELCQLMGDLHYTWGEYAKAQESYWEARYRIGYPDSSGNIHDYQHWLTQLDGLAHCNAQLREAENVAR